MTRFDHEVAMTARSRTRPTRRLIADVSERVLRESALLCVRLLPRAPHLEAAWEAVGARLSFSGPWQGHMEAWITRGVARLLATNLLGGDEPEGSAGFDAPDESGGVDALRESAGADALRELTGLLCDALLNAMAAGEPDVRLGTPSTCRRPCERRPETGTRDYWLEVEGEPMLLRLSLRRPAASPG